ncbi:hypothetical protein HID58_002037 [Brassica napus]|uniref:Uncharacterized protein n=1 Tax=Brassica napus TaxID=3708 RepID=A0ABQ8EP25_BRANA|nr:hypothetical protein HID58_002037 [Brassica napus]
MASNTCIKQETVMVRRAPKRNSSRKEKSLLIRPMTIVAVRIAVSRTIIPVFRTRAWIKEDDQVVRSF